jgi:hypothetical protein
MVSKAQVKPAKIRGPSAKMALKSQLTNNRNINAGKNQAKISFWLATISGLDVQKPNTERAVTNRYVNTIEGKTLKIRHVRRFSKKGNKPAHNAMAAIYAQAVSIISTTHIK